MNPINSLRRWLGNDGAITNARSLADERAAEDWTVGSLVNRLESGATPPPISDRPASAA